MVFSTLSTGYFGAILKGHSDNTEVKENEFQSSFDTQNFWDFREERLEGEV